MNEEPNPKCDVIVNHDVWRIEYRQQGVQVSHNLPVTTREGAMREAIAQGFRVIRLFRESEGHQFAEGSVLIPKRTLGKGEGE